MPTPDYIEIPLTQGQVARVSVHRYEEVAPIKWLAWWNFHTRSFYAVARIKIDGRWRTTYLHRYLLGLAHGDPRTGDHKDRNTLNNMDSNLRIATRGQQQHNKAKQLRNSTGYKGVREFKPGIFSARINVDRKEIHLGYRKSAKEAFEELYVPAAIKYHGEFACLD